MIWGFIFFGLMGLLLIYLLTAPLYVEINTVTGLYRIKFHRLFSVRFLYETDGWKTEVKVLWWSGLVKPEKKSKIPVHKVKKRKGLPGRKFIALIKSFKVKKIHLAYDSGDPAFNGICYPWVWLMGYWTGKDMSINFEGRNEIILVIKNTLGRMAWAYIRTKN